MGIVPHLWALGTNQHVWGLKSLPPCLNSHMWRKIPTDGGSCSSVGTNPNVWVLILTCGEQSSTIFESAWVLHWLSGKMRLCSAWLRIMETSKLSSRDYGDLQKLTAQFFHSNVKFMIIIGLPIIPKIKKWHEVFKTKTILYQDCELIIHFILCCFVKSPIEAI